MATWKQIENILDQVLELEEPERTRYIEEHINDEELKAEIRSLLQAELYAPAWIDTGLDQLLGSGNRLHKIADSLKDQTITIDRYQIVKEIGRGGMSVVYLAERTDGEFDQKVAVKIMQPFGIDREDRFRRLRAERQILANLQHPNIARVFDGGVTPEGWPYMVMELVDGIPITKYCNENNIDLNFRLHLFQNVCEAVIYAHRNLVVHRDLKPGNILVTETGQVKLLDFGIAKLLEDKDTLPLTQTGLPLMTPEYAAPEQFRGDTVTTSVDVYSLGVILYELLAGRRPYDLSDKSITEMERLVCEAEPPKPSQRNESRALNGDLDVICLKALRKEPVHRYTSVEEFKEDLLRYQRGLPIQAHPSSFRYKAQKFIKRNTAPLATVAFFLIAVTTFAIFHIYRVTEQRNIAQLEAEKATRIKNFTTNLFFANNRYYDGNVGEGITLQQVLETASRNVEDELSEDPEIYAEIQSLIGYGLKGVGEYDKAKAALEKSLEISIALYGEIHPLNATTMTQLGQLEGSQGNYEAAFSWHNRSLSINTAIYGETSTQAALNHVDLGRIYAIQFEHEKADEYYQKGLAIFKELGEKESLDYNLALSELINLQIRQGLLDEAEKNQFAVLENLKQLFGDQHASIADAYGRLSEIYMRKSDFEESEKYSRMRLDLGKKLWGTEHPYITSAYDNLGRIHRLLGNYEESEKYTLEAIRIFQKNSLTDSLTFSIYLNNLAIIKKAMGQPDSSIALYNDVLKIKRKVLTPENPSITVSMYNLAVVYADIGEFEEAHTLFEEVVERDKQSLGEEHPEVAVDLIKLAAVYRDMNQYTLAEKSFQEAEPIFNDKFPGNHYRIGEFYKEYGRLKIMQGQNDKAIDFLNKSMAIFKENYDDDHDNVKSVEKYLAAISQNQ